MVADQLISELAAFGSGEGARLAPVVLDVGSPPLDEVPREAPPAEPVNVPSPTPSEVESPGEQAPIGVPPSGPVEMPSPGPSAPGTTMARA